MLEAFTVIGGLFGMLFVWGLNKEWKSTMLFGIISVVLLTTGILFL